MKRDEFSELRALIEVAHERSFTRAAANLGVTRSALSHTIRALEERLGIQLLSRTTRDVAPTAAGERLIEGIVPHFQGIATEVEAMGSLRSKPAGNVRIVCPDDAITIVFRSRMPAFLKEYPDINVELVADNGLTNIVESQFDAGVRLGEAIALDMVAVRVSPDIRYVVAGSEAYLAASPSLDTPDDLMRHQCINLRLPTSGAIYAWEFQKGDREFSVRVSGQLTFNNYLPAVEAALDGVGLIYAPRAFLEDHLASGRLQEALNDWTPTFQGYHLYYPSRRNLPPAFSAFVKAFRCRSGREA
ncbi:MAG: LysR family transcriptional regulator [Paracoccus sp. (in: a-proteobacteria)]|uniref:LysR family transcriptional regulator n=1 Tax=Paracoccus sp. TaxID=267 RepID=UPI0026E10BAD|nr:LysR family transcriptional regulator [Paracoccus sp. (in: a-proteobacteria)]MDO5613326.1 LysR family transcriptional regulator [Paracoccus sp. (in: a-proteobacteria)]